MAASATLTVTIPAELADALREAVAANEYASVDDALADALAAWAGRHEEQEEAEAWVRAKIKASLADPRPGMTSDQVKAHLHAFIANVERSADEAA